MSLRLPTRVPVVVIGTASQNAEGVLPGGSLFYSVDILPAIEQEVHQQTPPSSVLRTAR